MRPIFVRSFLLRQYATNPARRNIKGDSHSYKAGVSGVLDAECPKVEEAVERFHNESRFTKFTEKLSEQRQQDATKRGTGRG